MCSTVRTGQRSEGGATGTVGLPLDAAPLFGPTGAPTGIADAHADRNANVHANAHAAPRRGADVERHGCRNDERTGKT